MEGEKIIINIEINRKSSSALHDSIVKKEVEKYLCETKCVVPSSVIIGKILPEDVNFVRVCQVENIKFAQDKIVYPAKNVIIHYYVYSLSDEKQTESMHDDSRVEVPSSEHWMLPNSEFEGLWETLIYDEDIKNNLLKYVRTSVLLSKHKVSTNVISWNSVVLLHGPPGTGKTSLCKALAQKLAIRLSSIYTSGQLIEINAHSLFSKWFSESGKLVMKMFNKIQEWLTDQNSFVCILIDEVESLAHARQSALNGQEPSDSIRVVNSVLTQLDSLRRHPNVLVLTTSNITGAIDLAFADRADIKQFIGYPSKWAVYQILKSCVDELSSKGLLRSKGNTLFNFEIIKSLTNCHADGLAQFQGNYDTSNQLLDAASASLGLSGRSLRKIPFLALARNFEDENSLPTFSEFFAAMKEVAVKMLLDNQKFFKTS